MTRKRIGSGLLESFSETCEHCNGRGIRVSLDHHDHSPRGRKPAGVIDPAEVAARALSRASEGESEPEPEPESEPEPQGAM
jgi:ribonuclease E